MEGYEAILERMRRRFTEQAGYEADDASDIGIRLRVLAGEIFSLRSALDWLERQSFSQSASGEQLDLRARERGLTRETPDIARGSLEFSRPDPIWYPAHIPEGTVCATADGTRFVTTEEGLLPIGQLKVTVAARAEQGGRSGNAAAGTVTVMITPPPGIQSVRNNTAFAGGRNGESDGDLRKRLLESFQNVSNGSNAAFYQACALRHAGVYSAGVVPRENGPGTVGLYLAGRGAAASAQTVEEVRGELEALREINVQISVAPAQIVRLSPIEITVTPADGVSFAEAERAVRAAAQDYFDALTVGEAVYRAALLARVFATGLLKNVNLGSMGDRLAGPNQLLAPGGITIR